MKHEIAKRLKEEGFPEITRVAAELNLYRYRSMSHPEVSHPFLQELLAETKNVILVKNKSGSEYAACEYDVGVWMEEKTYADTPANRESGHAGKKFLSGYIDESFDFFRDAEPDNAVALLWLEQNRKNKLIEV